MDTIETTSDIFGRRPHQSLAALSIAPGEGGDVAATRQYPSPPPSAATAAAVGRPHVQQQQQQQHGVSTFSRQYRGDLPPRARVHTPALASMPAPTLHEAHASAAASGRPPPVSSFSVRYRGGDLPSSSSSLASLPRPPPSLSASAAALRRRAEAAEAAVPPPPTPRTALTRFVSAVQRARHGTVWHLITEGRVPLNAPYPRWVDSGAPDGAPRDTPLSHAARVGDVRTVDILLSLGAHVDGGGGDSGAARASPLLIALHEGHANVVGALLAAGASAVAATARDSMRAGGGVYKYVSFLHAAIAADMPFVLAPLIRAGASLELEDGVPALPALAFALHTYHDFAMDVLLRAGASVHARLRALRNGTCVHLAAAQGRTPALRTLLGAGARVSPRDADGDTPLHVAVRRGHTDFARELLGAGAHAHVANAWGETPLLLAVQRDATELYAHLLANGAQLRASSHRVLTSAHRDGARIISHSPLALAIERDAVRSVDALFALAGGADVPLNAEGDTPLHWAARMRAHRVARSLCARRGKVDVNALNVEGDTPLLICLKNDDLQLASVLLEAGARVDIADAHGVTPLHVAVARASFRAVALVLRHGGDPHARNAFTGESALELAHKIGKKNVVYALEDAAGPGGAAVTGGGGV